MDRPTADAAIPDDATTGPTDGATPDAEQAERLSRAARGVVHEPADPRLEKAFGHLGLFPDQEPEPSGPAPVRTGSIMPLAPAVTPGPAPAVDVEPLRRELEELRAAVARLDRRIGTVIGLLAVLAVVVGVLAALVVVTGA